jgi:hypothetical protein
MRAVNQQDRIALSQNDFPKTITAVGKEINRNDALLDDKHLLCIVDPALDFKMVVSLFDETGLMGQQPELKRRALRREEYALVDARTGPDDLGISPAIMLNHFETHSATPSFPCRVKTIGSAHQGPNDDISLNIKICSIDVLETLMSRPQALCQLRDRISPISSQKAV